MNTIKIKNHENNFNAVMPEQKKMFSIKELTEIVQNSIKTIFGKTEEKQKSKIVENENNVDNEKQWFNLSIADGNEAEIFIYDEIGGWGIWADEIVNEIKNLNIEKLTLRINSPGGSVMHGLTIYNFLRSRTFEINVVIDGMAASIASVIAMAGDTIKMNDSSLMMIHDPWMIALGDSDQLRKDADILDKMKKSIITAYTSKTGKSENEISDLMSAETWLNATEALEMNFIDEIIEIPQSAAASIIKDFKPEKFGFKNFNNKKNTKEKLPMDEKQLIEKYPELYNSIVTTVQITERDRVAALIELNVNGSDEIINDAITNGSTAGDVAIEIVKNQKAAAKKQLDARAQESAEGTESEDAPADVTPTTEDTEGTDPDKIDNDKIEKNAAEIAREINSQFPSKN